MKKLIFLLIVATSFLYASNYRYNKAIKYYKEKNYAATCKMGLGIYDKYGDSFATMIGLACSKADSINILGDIIKKLYKTKDDRMNASYFATLILEKKLLYQFMNDGINLQNLSLPKTPHILSRVFEKISSGQYKITDKVNKKIEITDGEYKYILWLSNDVKRKMYIDEYKQDMLLKRHWYL